MTVQLAQQELKEYKEQPDHRDHRVCKEFQVYIEIIEKMVQKEHTG